MDLIWAGLSFSFETFSVVLFNLAILSAVLCVLWFHKKKPHASFFASVRDALAFVNYMLFSFFSYCRWSA